VRHTIGASEAAALKGAHAAMVIHTVPGSLRRWRIPAGLLSLLIVGSLAAPLTALAAITSVIVGAQVQDPVTAGNTATYAVTVFTDSPLGAAITDVSGLPAGASFTSNCILANSSGTNSITLSIPTLNTTLSGDYTIGLTVTEYTDGTCTTPTGNTDTSQSPTLSVRHAQSTLVLTGASSPAVFYDMQTLSTTGGTGSGLVTFSTGASTACSVAADVLTITAASGTCSVTATKAGDENFAAKTSAAVDITVGPATLTVTPDDQPLTYGDAVPTYTFGVAGFRNSETAGAAAGYLAPDCTSTYGSSTPVASSPLAISCTGGAADNYVFDTSATGALTIAKADPDCSSIAGYSVPYDAAPHVATGTCQGVGSDGTLTGLDLTGTTHTAAGTYATDPWAFTDVSGNYNDAAGTIADSIGKAAQAITFGALADRTLGDADFLVSATASSGLAVTFGSLTSGVCTVSGATVHLASAGVCTVQADQAGNGNFAAATPVSRSFTVAAHGTVTRRFGADRYATSAAISAAAFDPGVGVVYIATGANYPDALAAGPAAAAGGGPVLLVKQGSIPSAVATELARLDPGRIVVLGGPTVISDVVKSALQAYTAGTVTRLYGADRYATAAAVSAATFSPGVAVAYVAVGTNYPDALSGGPAAGALGGPILLVTGTGIPAVTATELTRLDPGRIVILGGTGVISSGVETSLHAFTGGTVSRLAGSDRYATSAAISAATFPPGVGVVYVATGENYPDALAGGPAAVAGSGPVLLVHQSSIPSAVAAELDRLNPGNIVVLGGSGVISDTVFTALAFYLNP
jgi:putative cell wall-binding protein